MSAPEVNLKPTGSNANLPLIVGLVTPADRGRLRDDPTTPAMMANTYGLRDLDDASSPLEGPLLEEAKAEARRVTGSARAMRRYATMILNLAYPEHREYVRQRTDPLTGLQNRLAFGEDLQRAIAWGRGTPLPEHEFNGEIVPVEPSRGVAFIWVDIDYFKDVNDGPGHALGDDALKALAELFASALRDDSELYRWGGDEFAAMIRAHEQLGKGSEKRDQEAMAVEGVLAGAVARFRKIVSEGITRVNDDIRSYCIENGHVFANGEPIVPPLRASIGVHLLQEGDNESIILRKLDKSMYDDKDGGKRADAAEDRAEYTEDEMELIRRVLAIVVAKQQARQQRLVKALGVLAPGQD